MDRAERLLDLVTLFLNAREPVTFRQLRDHFEDYSGVAFDSALRKFERDKAELLDLGLPLSYEAVGGDEEGEGGYRLDPASYFLPPIELTPTELTLLGVAGAAASTMESFPFKAQVARALEKIGFAAQRTQGSDDDRSAPRLARLSVHSRPRGDPDRVGAAFVSLQDAIARRKVVTLDYHSLYEDRTTRREVEPQGLILRDGAWVLQAHCRLREGPRTFLLDRIVSLAVNEKKPKSPDFELPDDLDLLALARLRPWSYPVESSQEAVLRLETRQAFLASSLFGNDAIVTPSPDGSARVGLSLRYPEALLEQVLRLRGACTLLAPEALRARLRERLEAVVKQHQEEGA